LNKTKLAIASLSFDASIVVATTNATKHTYTHTSIVVATTTRSKRYIDLDLQ
jgi:hypothetical protein